MPSPVLLCRYGFCNFFTWFSMDTVFWVRLQFENLVPVASARFLPDLFNVRYHCLWYLFEFLFRETVRVILLCQLVHLYALLLGPANFELRFTTDLFFFFLKTIVNTFVMFILRVNSFAASLPRWRLFGTLSVLRFLPYRAPWQRPFLITWCGIERASSLSLPNFLLEELAHNLWEGWIRPRG